MFSNNNSKKNSTNNNNKILKSDLENELDNTFVQYNVVQLKLKFKKLVVTSLNGWDRPDMAPALFHQEIESLEKDANNLMKKIESLKTQLKTYTQTSKSLNLKSKWAFFKNFVGLSNTELLAANKHSVSGLVVRQLAENQQLAELKNLAEVSKFWNKEASLALEPFKQARLATLEKYKTKDTFDQSKYTYLKPDSLVKIKERIDREPLTTSIAMHMDPFYEEHSRVLSLWLKMREPSDALDLEIASMDALLNQKYLMIVYLNKFEDGSITKEQIKFIKDNINLVDNEDKNKLLNTFPEIFAPENNSLPRPR